MFLYLCVCILRDWFLPRFNLELLYFISSSDVTYKKSIASLWRYTEAFRTIISRWLAFALRFYVILKSRTMGIGNEIFFICKFYATRCALNAHWTLRLPSTTQPTAYNNAPLLCRPHLHIRNFARSSSAPGPPPSSIRYAFGAPSWRHARSHLHSRENYISGK